MFSRDHKAQILQVVVAEGGEAAAGGQEAEEAAGGVEVGEGVEQAGGGSGSRGRKCGGSRTDMQRDRETGEGGKILLTK